MTAATKPQRPTPERTAGRRLAARLARRLSDQRGVAAIEFALVAPIMIVLYFGAVEIADVLIADRKVTNVAVSVADLIAQTKEISDADIDDIFTVTSTIMEPYSGSALGIVATSVEVDGDGAATVGWSDGHNATAHAEGSDFDLPEGVALENSSVIVAEVFYTYSSIVGDMYAGTIEIEDTFYLKPRRTLSIERVAS